MKGIVFIIVSCLLISFVSLHVSFLIQKNIELEQKNKEEEERDL